MHTMRMSWLHECSVQADMFAAKEQSSTGRPLCVCELCVACSLAPFHLMHSKGRVVSDKGFA